jgi:hypothetical protein
MLVQEAVQHGAAAAEAHAEKFDAGEPIIHHVANSAPNEPLIHLPTIAGIDFSVTKHVFMLWFVARDVFIVITWVVRRVPGTGAADPSGFMNGLEAVVVFVRDDDRPAERRPKWVPTWTPLILTFFFFIVSANAIGLIPIFDVLAAPRPLRPAQRRRLVRRPADSRRHDGDRQLQRHRGAGHGDRSARSSSPAPRRTASSSTG